MRSVVAVALVLGLVGCARNYETFQPPPLDLGNRPPLRFAVAAVDIRSAFKPKGGPPYVEHTFVLTPEAATRQLLEHRLAAVGGPGRLQAVILDASVTEQKLETKTGIQGYLATEPAARFEGRLKVRVDHLDDAGNVQGSVSTEATRTKALPEDIGYAERQRLGYELVRELIDDLDAGLTANLRETFASLLRS
ncbi:MAG TPA: hypothetical protein VHQ91_14770 [Geminicoccaceae bacterium]|nr:hypothetical protein [Geminicoccaceae bacterium]